MQHASTSRGVYTRISAAGDSNRGAVWRREIARSAAVRTDQPAGAGVGEVLRSLTNRIPEAISTGPPTRMVPASAPIGAPISAPPMPVPTPTGSPTVVKAGTAPPITQPTPAPRMVPARLPTVTARVTSLVNFCRARLRFVVAASTRVDTGPAVVTGVAVARSVEGARAAVRPSIPAAIDRSVPARRSVGVSPATGAAMADGV